MDGMGCMGGAREDGDGMRCDGTDWDGMGWHGMGWDGMGRDEIGWDGMGWHGMGGHRADASWATSQTGWADGHLSMPGDADRPG